MAPNTPEEIGGEITARLQHFVELMAKWNRVYNLTAVRNAADMWSTHILDSLTLLPHLEANTALLDVGSGAGLPGIPIAIARPDVQVTSVDSVDKKITFQRQAVAELMLTNHRPLHARIESLHGAYPVIVCRAYASLADFIATTRHLIDSPGRWLAMKAELDPAELRELPPDIAYTITPLQVEGTNWRRHLIELRLR